MQVPSYSSTYPVSIHTPYVGVWIETVYIELKEGTCIVTPYVGVWIETRIKE